MLRTMRSRDGVEYRVVAVDPLASRREKMIDILFAIRDVANPDNIVVGDLETAKEIINEWTNSIGCNAVLEVTTFSCGKSSSVLTMAKGCG